MSGSKRTTARVLLIGGCGYIGSYLYPRLVEASYDVVVCDRQTRGNPGGVPVQFGDYAQLSREDLAGFDAVLWFAGHSSVQQAVQDPQGALENNCLDMFTLFKRLPSKTKFIYASTASLYSTREITGLASTENSLINIPSQNAYDASKFAFDYLAKNFLDNYYGLRMGTLSGYSPNLRSELVFNAMNIAAVQQGQVRLRNGESRRTILFLSDLWVLVKNLLESEHQSGFYNAGSHSSSMVEIATGVASTWGAKIRYEGDSETYSFTLDCTRMKAICGADLVALPFEERCRQFIAEYQKGQAS